ncbi:glycosyltransferase [Aquiflexum gelatinilyticum]|uniref:Glycosyltransferase n=1 Tax=Aquiflexum gelatinilyticum TaxID=2961943 RepID=A0A9X2SYK2_9BACT|nr:glycosyltransferase [Aquiflexum gelatinilyticum]MCR9015467.1 glycosyltransferase [Aquiflexum gelatinilyticum]MCS4433116.1 glycosyltransferase [Aquiflexum gelatinilyticum]
MSNPSPICLFVYKRLLETKLTIQALEKNHLAKESELYIFSDGPKNEKDIQQVEEVRNYIKEVVGFKKVVINISNENKGLAKSIINGVSSILELNESVIVLEDDLLTSPNFLIFMNEALTAFEHRNDIQSINGYSPFIKASDTLESDVYLHYRTFSWGWATWRSSWSPEIFLKQKINHEINQQTLIDFDLKCGHDMSVMLKSALAGKIDSWYIYWAYDHFKNNRLAVYPYLSKIDNIGYGVESTHCDGVLTIISKFDTAGNREFKLPKNISKYDQTIKNVNYYFTKKHKFLFRIKMLRKLKNYPILFREIKKKFLK